MREHVLMGYDCWCGPTLHLPCDECGHLESWAQATEGLARVHTNPEDLGTVQTNCWKCTNGLLPLTRAEADACEETVLVVHRDG